MVGVIELRAVFATHAHTHHHISSSLYGIYLAHAFVLCFFVQVRRHIIIIRSTIDTSPPPHLFLFCFDSRFLVSAFLFHYNTTRVGFRFDCVYSFFFYFSETRLSDLA